MICIEHFTKWVELIALPDKSSKSTAHALFTHVLSRFGAPRDIITDQGAEFEGAFTDLLVGHRVTHRTAAREHPQSDGLAERMVQTMKLFLRKILLKEHRTDWDIYLPYVAMGYRMTKQASTGYSPYYLLYGRHPIFQAQR